MRKGPGRFVVRFFSFYLAIGLVKLVVPLAAYREYVIAGMVDALMAPYDRPERTRAIAVMDVPPDPEARSDSSEQTGRYYYDFRVDTPGEAVGFSEPLHDHGSGMEPVLALALALPEWGLRSQLLLAASGGACALAIGVLLLAGEVSLWDAEIRQRRDGKAPSGVAQALNEWAAAVHDSLAPAILPLALSGAIAMRLRARGKTAANADR